MVRKIIAAVYQEIRGLHQAAYIIALFALGSQLLALVRDRLLAHQFGAGIELDIYYSAFRIPDLLYVFFASTLSVYVLIPFVTKRIDEGGTESARRLLSQIFSLFLIVYSGLAAVLIALTPVFIGLLFPGFSGAHEEQLVLLTRILLLQPLFLGISSLFGVITQLQGRFVLYALSPLLYNVGIIAGVLFFYPMVGLWGLAFGVVLGAFLHLSVQIPYILGTQLVPAFTRVFNKAVLIEIFKVSIPRALTLSLHQLVFLILAGIASVMIAGSVSVFQFAYNIQSVPLTIIGVSYSVAAFPTLAKLFSKGQRSAFVDHVLSALRHILFWSIPVAALVIVLRAQIVRVILGSGAFGWDDTRLTAAALAIFSISLIAQAINLLIIRAFYASGNTRTPLLVTLVSSAGSIAFALCFYGLFLYVPSFVYAIERLFRVEGVAGTEVLALPLGYTVALLLHIIVLLVLFNRMQQIRLSILTNSFLRSLAAGMTAGLGAYGALNLFASGLATDTFLGIFFQGLVGGIAGIASAILLLYLVKSPELLEAIAAFKRKVRRSNVVAPEDIDDPSV